MMHRRAWQDERGTRYNGPPGDTRDYWLPMDLDAWDAAWKAYNEDRERRHAAVAARNAPQTDEGPVSF